nr:uncharacterized protein LOC101787337 isoform X1 [Cavia porcellus]
MRATCRAAPRARCPLPVRLRLAALPAPRLPAGLSAGALRPGCEPGSAGRARVWEGSWGFRPLPPPARRASSGWAVLAAAVATAVAREAPEPHTRSRRGDRRREERTAESGGEDDWSEPPEDVPGPRSCAARPPGEGPGEAWSSTLNTLSCGGGEQREVAERTDGAPASFRCCSALRRWQVGEKCPARPSTSGTVVSRVKKKQHEMTWTSVLLEARSP